MTVYKAYMKITKKNIWMILMYLAIFFSLTVMFQRIAAYEEQEGYRSKSVPVGVVNEDGGALSESLIRAIGAKNEVIPLENDKEILQENLFYRNVEYIVRIPENFAERCIRGEESLKVTTVPSTYAGSYVDEEINSFLNFSRCYFAAGFSEEEIAEAMETREEAEVTLIDFSGNAGQAPAYTYYYRYLPFLFLSVLCYILGYILMGFSRGSLPGRMKASPVSVRRQTLEGLLAVGTLAAGLWIFCTAGAYVMYGSELVKSGTLPYQMANSLALLFVSLAIGHLIGMLVKNSNALSGIVNIVTLGMCFLCGAYVEMEYLSEGVKRVAQFLPVYWYEQVNELLADYGAVTESIRIQIWQGIGIQMLFAAALVGVIMAVSRQKE